MGDRSCMLSIKNPYQIKRLCLTALKRKKLLNRRNKAALCWLEKMLTTQQRLCYVYINPYVTFHVWATHCSSFVRPHNHNMIFCKCIFVMFMDKSNCFIWDKRVSASLESHTLHCVRQLPAALQPLSSAEDNMDRCSFDRPRWPSNRLRPRWRKTGWPAWSKNRWSWRQKWKGWRRISTTLHPPGSKSCR